MVILLLALIGLVAGLGLDALVVRLAVPPDDDDEDGDEVPEEAPAPALASVHAEAGSLVVPASPVQTWVRRILIVGATAGLFAAAAARYDDISQLAVITAYVSVLIVCAGTDALSYRVPNVVTYPAIVGALFVGVLMPGADILEVLAGGALAGGLLFLPSIFTGGVGMGMGDVKLATFVGLALGFAFAVPALVLMALAGGVAAVFLLVTRRRGRREAIPYAPFISIGALATMMWQGTAFISLMLM